MSRKLLLAQADSTLPMPTVPETASPLPPDAPPMPPDGFLDQLLAFIYTLAHWAGQVIVTVLDNLLPLQTPSELVDPIGFLTLLTVFLMIAEVAKKITWLVVVVGWVLIGVRIILEATQQQ